MEDCTSHWHGRTVQQRQALHVILAPWTPLFLPILSHILQKLWRHGLEQTEGTRQRREIRFVYNNLTYNSQSSRNTAGQMDYRQLEDPEAATSDSDLSMSENKAHVHLEAQLAMYLLSWPSFAMEIRSCRGLIRRHAPNLEAQLAIYLVSCTCFGST